MRLPAAPCEVPTASDSASPSFGNPRFPAGKHKCACSYSRSFRHSCLEWHQEAVGGKTFCLSSFLQVGGLGTSASWTRSRPGRMTPTGPAPRSNPAAGWRVFWTCRSFRPLRTSYRASTQQRVAVMCRTHRTTDESLYLIKRSIVSSAMASNPSNRGSVP